MRRPPASLEKCHSVGEPTPRGRHIQWLKVSEVWSGSFASCPEPGVEAEEYSSSWQVLASVLSSRRGGLTSLQLKISQRFSLFFLQLDSGIQSGNF